MSAVIVAECTPPDSDATYLIGVDASTRRTWPLAVPRAGRSLTRPVVSRRGAMAAYDIAAGTVGRSDNPLADQTLWLRQRNDATVPGTLVTEPSTWGPRGHVEWSPGSTRLVHAVWRWAGPRPGADYQIVTTDLALRNAKVVTPPGYVEPSWTSAGILAVRKDDGALVLLGADGAVRDVWPTPSTADPHPFDPYLSPDGRWIVYLERVIAGPLGLRLLDASTPPDRRNPADSGYVRWFRGPYPFLSHQVTQARWLDATTLCYSYAPAGRPWFSLHVHGLADADPVELTPSWLGDVSQAAPVPAGAPGW